MSTLEEWIADLDQAATSVGDETEKVVSKGALNIKKAWRDRWSGHSHIPDLPEAISYDVDRGDGAISAEIGPDKMRRQGSLGNLIEFGSIHNTPIPGGMPALDAEDPRFVKALEDVGENLLAQR